MSILKKIKNSGIVEIENLYSNDLINDWNIKIDKIIDKNFDNNSKKVEINFDELVENGIVEQVLNNKLKSAVASLINDPILYLFSANEISGYDNKPHVNNNSIGGWHYDITPLNYLDRKNPNFITIFIYLSDVMSFEDGPFEICSDTDLKFVNNQTPTKKILGKKGKCFIWNNSFIHRASPNRGPFKRRIIKLGFKNNYFQNDFIGKLNKNYCKIKDKDDFTDFAFGKYHYSTEKSKKLPDTYKTKVNYKDFDYNSKIKLNLKTRVIKILKKII